MHGVFDPEEFQQLGRQRDTELTLGPFKLLVLFCGLVLLCGLCFGLGYTMGSHRAKNAAVAPQAPAVVVPAPATPIAQPKKPSASSQNASQHAPANAELPASDPDQVVVQNAPTATPAASTGPWVVKPALPPQPSAARPTAQPAPVQHAVAGKAQPASSAVPLMVQIAAVAHQEDAQVLMSALRKRGFSATARHDPTDGLLHVQIGPFATWTAAAAMRQKLLNDGYNAIVQP
jgi:cell division septation protein DedD